MSCDIIFESKDFGRILAPNGLWLASSEDGKSTKIHFWHRRCMQTVACVDVPISFDAFVAYTQECKRNNTLADLTKVENAAIGHHPIRPINTLHP